MPKGYKRFIERCRKVFMGNTLDYQEMVDSSSAAMRLIKRGGRANVRIPNVERQAKLRDVRFAVNLKPLICRDSLIKALYQKRYVRGEIQVEILFSAPMLLYHKTVRTGYNEIYGLAGDNMRAEDNIGKRYGCYTIIGVSDTKTADRHRKYIAQCYCGKIFETYLSTIKRVNKCRHATYINNKSFLFPNFQSIPLRRIYRSMLYRCYNPRSKDYKYYGAKSICVCDEWLNNPQLFEQWSYENGYCDNRGLSIDRIQEDGNYEPNNCRWIDTKENSRFKSTTNYITATVTLSGRQWASLIPSVGCNYINTLARNKGEKEAIKFIEKSLCNKHDINNISY